MKIGVIGTGAIGGIIAKKMVRAGHTVKISNSKQGAELNAKAEELGAIASTTENVVRDVDVVVISVPTVAIPTLPKDLFADVPENVIVVDTSNYYPFRDADIEEIKNGKVESIWVSEQLGRPVVKASTICWRKHWKMAEKNTMQKTELQWQSQEITQQQKKCLQN